MHTLLSTTGSDRATAYNLSSRLIRREELLYVGWLDAPLGPGQPARIMLGVCDVTTLPISGWWTPHWQSHHGQQRSPLVVHFAAKRTQWRLVAPDRLRMGEVRVLAFGCLLLGNGAEGETLKIGRACSSTTVRLTTACVTS